MNIDLHLITFIITLNIIWPSEFNKGLNCYLVSHEFAG